MICSTLVDSSPIPVPVADPQHHGGFGGFGVGGFGGGHHGGFGGGGFGKLCYLLHNGLY